MAVVRSLAGHSNYVWTASFSLDGSHVVTCSSDETARVWNLADGGSTASMQTNTTARLFTKHTFYSFQGAPWDISFVDHVTLT